MKIKKIAATNYGSLEAVEINFTSYYCTLSGRNNAGKSNVIKLILCLLGDNTKDNLFFFSEQVEISYMEDATQWVEKPTKITIQYDLEASRRDDPALINFLEKLIESKLETEEVSINVQTTGSEKTAPIQNFNQWDSR